MKVNELVEMYKKNLRLDFEKQLEVKKYIGIAAKRELAKLVLDNCTTIVDGEVHIDSVERYILFTIAVIGIHTNLEFSSEDDDNIAMDNYDILCESGVLPKVIETFKDDYMSCQEILNMMTTDRLQENITLEKKISKFLDTIANIFNVAIDGLVDKLDLSSLDLSQINQENVIQILDLIKK